MTEEIELLCSIKKIHNMMYFCCRQGLEDWVSICKQPIQLFSMILIGIPKWIFKLRIELIVLVRKKRS